MGDSPIAGAGAYTSSGLEGTAASGDGEPCSDFFYAQRNFTSYEHRSNLPSAFPVQFFILHINIDSPLPSQQVTPGKRLAQGEAISITQFTVCFVHFLFG